MDYLIIYHGEPIGKLVEPGADFVQGIVGGPFIPLPAYKNIQSVFRAYAQIASAKLNSEQRDAERMSHLARSVMRLPLNSLLQRLKIRLWK